MPSTKRLQPGHVLGFGSGAVVLARRILLQDQQRGRYCSARRVPRAPGHSCPEQAAAWSQPTSPLC